MTTTTRDLVNSAALSDEHFVRPAREHGLSPNALTVLQKRYLKKDAKGNPIESPEEMFWRVALTIAKVEARYGGSTEQIQTWAEKFYHMMLDRFWEPNSPTLMNAGRPLGQLSACFVLPVDDALANGKDGIYDTLKHMALVHQSGGGTGFSFSRIRPEGSMVKSTTGVASGPVSFMRLYDASTEVVKQGGTRRGANMGVLRVDHPDILEFIACKEDVTQITNFNISVAVTDEFMEAVKNGTKYDLIDPATGEKWQPANDRPNELDARSVFDNIVDHAWATGEPGVLFIDRANRYNPVPHLGEYEATNPCGEQFLLGFDVCNLGSLNIGLFIRTDLDPSLPWQERVDWERYEEYAKLSTRFLDNVIDANNYPLAEIRNLADRIRRIGNGVMGWADALIRLGIPYNSDEGVEAAREFARRFYEAALEASEDIASERGTFPEWERSIWGPDESCARLPSGERVRPMRKLRNCNINTVAPTGTISIFAGCSGGIEPLFAVAFMRNQAGSLMPDVNPDFVSIAKKRGFYSEDLIRRIAEAGHIHFPEVPEDVQRTFVTAHDISPEYHVRMQAVWQEFTDSSISKTTNFAESATREDVHAIYLLAYELGCKGVTVYRDNCRPFQVLSTGKNTVTSTSGAPSDAVTKLQAELAEMQSRNQDLVEKLSQAGGRKGKRKRPDMLRGSTRRTDSPLGEMFVTINEDESRQPFELFATLGKAGSIAMADTEAIGRLSSLALRFGVPIEEIYTQLRGISSDKAIGFGVNQVLSVPDAIAQVVGKYLQEKAGVQEELPLASAAAAPTRGEVESASPKAATAPNLFDLPNNQDHLMESCPDCQVPGSFVRESGCLKCLTPGCGFSKCG